MAKSFLQIFERYNPSDEYARILERAENIKIQADKENRMLNASVDFCKSVLLTSISFNSLTNSTDCANFIFTPYQKSEYNSSGFISTAGPSFR